MTALGSTGCGIRRGLLLAAIACSSQPPVQMEPFDRAEVLAQRIQELNAAGRYGECVVLAEALAATQLQTLGPDHEGTAESFNAWGYFLRAAGRPGEAIPLHERALAIYTPLLGPRAPETARTHDLLGSARLAAGDPAGAEPDLVAALEIFRSTRPQSLEAAHSLNNVGYLRRLQGRSAEARLLFKQSLALLQAKSSGDKGQESLPVLRNLAALDAEAGDLKAALEGLEIAFEISRKLQGNEHPDTARVQGELAAVLLELDNLSGAHEVYTEALATADKVLEPRHPDRGRYLGGLGAVAKARGQYRHAQELFAEALTLYEKVRGPEHPDTATASSDLGTTLELLGQIQEAVSCYERALAIQRKVYGPRGLPTATTLENLGTARERLGDLAKARELQEEALAIRKEKLEPRHPDIARSLHNLGRLFRTLGDLARAEACYEEALAIRLERFGPKHSSTASSWNSLAALCKDRGDLACAQEGYERALAIWEEVLDEAHPRIAVALNNLAMVMAALGHPERARQLLTRAQEIAEKAYGAEHPLVATVVENLGSLFRFSGDVEGERRHLEKALDLRVRSLGADHPEVALSHHNLGVLLRSLGRVAESRQHLERAVALRKELLGEDHASTGDSLLELAATEMEAGSVDRAFDLAERAADVEELRVRRVVTLGSDADKRLFLRTIAGLADWSVSTHLQGNPASTRAATLALTAVLRTKGRALDAAAAGREQLRHRLSPEERALLAKLAGLRGEQAALLLRSEPGTEPGQIQGRLRELADEIRRIEAELARRSASGGKVAPSVTMESVQKRLPAEAALIELVIFQPWSAKARGNPWGEPRVAAYVLRSTGVPVAIDLGEAESIDRAARALRHALSEPQSASGDEGRALDALTMAKIRPLLGAARILLIAPDGELNLVPFAALVDEKNHYLLQHYQISYLSSGRELVADVGEERCNRREPPLIVGNPDFDWRAPGAASREAAADSFPPSVDPLPGAAAEAVAVAALFGVPSSRILTGSSASETAVKAVRGPWLLHLATHGLFLSEPLREEKSSVIEGDRLLERARETRVEVFLRSGMALAGYNRRRQARGADDGLLTALEVIDRDLCGTELVTLSACETGLGEVRSGQGVFGLRRSFALAGARSQLLTLWKVPDWATKDLMVSFYTRVRQGVGLAEALRQAQLDALGREPIPEDDRGGRPPGRPEGTHPYLWASFVLSGRAALDSMTREVSGIIP